MIRAPYTPAQIVALWRDQAHQSAWGVYAKFVKPNDLSTNKPKSNARLADQLICWDRVEQFWATLDPALWPQYSVTYRDFNEWKVSVGLGIRDAVDLFLTAFMLWNQDKEPIIPCVEAEEVEVRVIAALTLKEAYDEAVRRGYRHSHEAVRKAALRGHLAAWTYQGLRYTSDYALEQWLNRGAKSEAA